MKKSKNQPANEVPGMLESLDEIRENPYFQWLVEKRNILPFVFLAIIGGIALIFYFTSSKKIDAETSFVQAENQLALLERSPQTPFGDQAGEAAVKKLLQITTDYPQLRPKYDGIVAQYLLIDGDVGAAGPLVERNLKRTKDEGISLFADFSRTTLHVAEKDYAKALEESEKLKASLQEQGSIENYYSKLFAYNMLRIALLQKELGKKEAERDTWKEWQRYSSGNHPALAQAFHEVGGQLQFEGFSLEQYIGERNKELTPVKP